MKIRKENSKKYFLCCTHHFLENIINEHPIIKQVVMYVELLVPTLKYIYTMIFLFYRQFRYIFILNSIPSRIIYFNLHHNLFGHSLNRF